MKNSYRVLDEEGIFQPGNMVCFDTEKGFWELFDPKKHKFFWGMVMERNGDIAVISIYSENYKK